MLQVRVAHRCVIETTRATHLLSKLHSYGELLAATLRSIPPARDLNLRPLVPEKNVLPFDQNLQWTLYKASQNQVWTINAVTETASGSQHIIGVSANSIFQLKWSLIITTLTIIQHLFKVYGGFYNMCVCEQKYACHFTACNLLFFFSSIYIEKDIARHPLVNTRDR